MLDFLYRTAPYFAITISLAACQVSPTLKPASHETAAPSSAGAIETARGVRITATGESWPGLAAIKERVTPLRLTIENHSDLPLAVTYANLDLIAKDGTNYSALPLYAIEGDVTHAVIPRRYPPIADPTFASTGYWLAPYYGGIYTGFGYYPGPFYVDRAFYNAYYPYYAEIDLPTTTMLRHALPEGVLDPGGRVEGWVYFQKLGDAVEQATLRADLLSAKTGMSVAELRITFDVAS